MAKTKLICAGGDITITADRYTHIVGSLSSTITTETRAQITIQQGGTLSKFAANVVASTSGVCDFRIRKNGANGNQVVSFASGETGIKEDLSNTDSVVAGDEINVFHDFISGTNISIANTQVVFDSSTNTYQLFAGGSNGTAQNDNLTRFYIFSELVALPTETDGQAEMLTAGTLKHFFVNVTANTHTTVTSTFTPRINAAAAGSISVAYAFGEIGIKEDTANTATVANGDDCNFRLAIPNNPGTTSITFSTISIGFETTNSQYQETSIDNASLLAFNNTQFVTIHGLISINSTESFRQTTSRTGDTDLKELLCEVSVNTITTSATTIDYRINGGGNHLQISYAATEIGIKSVTGTIAIVDGDEINYRIITPNTSGDITFQQFSSLYTPTPAPVAVTTLSIVYPPTGYVV